MHSPEWCVCWSCINLLFVVHISVCYHMYSYVYECMCYVLNNFVTRWNSGNDGSWLKHENSSFLLGTFSHSNSHYELDISKKNHWINSKYFCFSNYIQLSIGIAFDAPKCSDVHIMFHLMCLFRRTTQCTIFCCRKIKITFQFAFYLSDIERLIYSYKTDVRMCMRWSVAYFIVSYT